MVFARGIAWDVAPVQPADFNSNLPRIVNLTSFVYAHCMRTFISVFILLSLVLPASSLAQPAGERVIGGVVASVNGEPVTLLDLLKRLNPPRPLTMSEAARDQEARQVLDVLIEERVLESEAERQRAQVREEEIEAYINQVAERNNLSREEFEEALRLEGQSLEKFRSMVRMEATRAKLAQSIMRAGVPISEDEVDRIIADHPAFSRTGSSIRLSQIFIPADESDVEVREQLEEVRALVLAGENFAELAKQYSYAPEAAYGGSLGVMAEQDLSPEIFRAVMGLQPGETSEIVSTGAGFHIFRVEERLSRDSTEDRERIRQEARDLLRQQKLEQRLQTYFTVELYKEHSVQKFI